MIYIIVSIHACFPNNWEWFQTPQPFSTYNSLNDHYLGSVLSVNQLNQGASQILWWDADTNEKSVQTNVWFILKKKKKQIAILTPIPIATLFIHVPFILNKYNMTTQDTLYHLCQSIHNALSFIYLNEHVASFTWSVSRGGVTIQDRHNG